jgi:hypothetical protein
MFSDKIKIIAIFAVMLFLPAAVLASETDGTIISGHQYSWCDHSGYVNFGLAQGNVHITDSGLTGYIWAANHGWINLNPDFGGVKNDGAGNLSGYAWGEQLGWIDFSKVKINSQGLFSGLATGTIAGRITFDCNHCDVRTDWLPASARNFCGNGVIETGESCDGADLGGQTCVGLGFVSGSLSCRSDCGFNTAGCANSVPTSGGGGGGGSSPAVTSVVFTGRAYPTSKITLLKDSQIAAVTVAGADANFSITLAGLTAGSYNFSIYSEDAQDNRSSVLTYPVTVTLGATVKVSDVFIAPTISVDKSEVVQGDNIAIFGQSVPAGNVTIQVNSQTFFATTTSDKSGAYLYNFDTAPLEIGQHSTKSKVKLQTDISSFGKTVGFSVGSQNIPSPSSKCPAKGDLNGDCKVNLIDFSIAAHWYKAPLSDDFKKIEAAELSGDGKIDLVDFSIMASYWTG